MEGSGDRSTATARLDSFVDAAFAFAVGLLVVTSGTPDSLSELRSILLGAPAFAFAFALLMIFWVAHREYGRLAPRRDGISFLLSVAVVFTVLLFVYPLRLLSQAMVRYVSGGVVATGPQLTSWDDLQLLYLVYGLFFTALAGLVSALFVHALRAPAAVGLTDPNTAREAAGRWACIAAVGALSALAALVLPLSDFPWAPGTVYWLIPLAMGFWSRLFPARSPASPPADASS